MSGPNYVTSEPSAAVTFSSQLFQGGRSDIKLTNVCGKELCFKVKTTAPRCYLVRPSSGVLQANARDVSIKLLLQPMADRPPPKDHRFMVQVVPTVKTGEVLTKEEWSALNRDNTQEIKLNVVFTEPAEAQRPTNASETRDLQSKYDELVKYAVILENDKKALQKAAEEPAKDAAVARRGYPLYVVLIAFILGTLLRLVV